MFSARSLKEELNYKEWRNFDGVIKRANNLIINGIRLGVIIESKISRKIGSGAKRDIIDYNIDLQAKILITELCMSHKITGFYSVRNETIVLGLINKYYSEKGYVFNFQKHVNNFIFDGVVNNVLIEFDEPHHNISNKQKKTDGLKNNLAAKLGFDIVRITLDMDIIDCIVVINNKLK